MGCPCRTMCPLPLFHSPATVLGGREGREGRVYRGSPACLSPGLPPCVVRCLPALAAMAQHSTAVPTVPNPPYARRPHRRMLVLPAPDGPMMSSEWPGSTDSVRSETRVVPLDGTRRHSCWMSSSERPAGGWSSRSGRNARVHACSVGSGRVAAGQTQALTAQQRAAAGHAAAAAARPPAPHHPPSPEVPGRSVMVIRPSSSAWAAAEASASSVDAASLTGSTVAAPPALQWVCAREPA